MVLKLKLSGMILLHSSFDDDWGWGGGFMLAVDPFVNVDDSFPLSHVTNLHRFHGV